MSNKVSKVYYTTINDKTVEKTATAVITFFQYMEHYPAFTDFPSYFFAPPDDGSRLFVNQTHLYVVRKDFKSRLRTCFMTLMGGKTIKFALEVLIYSYSLFFCSECTNLMFWSLRVFTLVALAVEDSLLFQFRIFNGMIDAAYFGKDISGRLLRQIDVDTLRSPVTSLHLFRPPPVAPNFINTPFSHYFSGSKHCCRTSCPKGLTTANWFSVDIVWYKTE